MTHRLRNSSSFKENRHNSPEWPRGQGAERRRKNRPFVADEGGCEHVRRQTELTKTSTRDDRLIRQVAKILSAIDPDLGGRIRFTEDRLSGMDAVIATGSDNSARYFEYYFREIPHIIRKNRNGVAVLTGNEPKEELAALGEDIFSYFGMGCRNVTKLYVPVDYDLKVLLAVLDRYQYLYQHHKYGNNVDYYRSIYLMNRMSRLRY